MTTAFPGRTPAATGPSARVSAVAVAFIANGLGAPSFLPRLPARQEDLGLSDAALGTVLLGLAAGALLASPIAGRAAGRFGSRPVVVSAAIALGASLWTAGAAPHPAVLFLAFLLIGAADASLDIAMNLNGAAYERTTGRLVMNRLHGAWSLGALVGGGLAAAAAAAGVALTGPLAVVGAGLALAVVATRHGLVRGDAGAGTPALAEAEVAATGHGDLASAPSAEPADATRAERPPTPSEASSGNSLRGRAMLTLAAATVAAALLEGGPYDWSAIRLERLGVGPGIAALGFAAFVTGMLAARLVGDHLAHRFGRREMLRGGMVLVAIGLGAGTLADTTIVFGLGLLVAGAGVSGLFPLVFSAGANTPGVAAGAGAAVVSLSARAGFLIEPPLMGVLGDTVGLRWAFLVLAGLALAMAAAARHVVPSSLADSG